MAKIVEDIIIIKFSKIVKDSEESTIKITNNEIQQALEQVAQELVNDSVIVEVFKDVN